MDWRENYLERKYALKKGEQQIPSTAGQADGPTEDPGNGIEKMIEEGQLQLAARRGFEAALGSYLRRFKKAIDSSSTYREFISDSISSFSAVSDSILTSGSRDALKFTSLLVWDNAPGRDQFEALLSLSTLYFESYEPFVYGGGVKPSAERMKLLFREAMGRSGTEG